MTSMFLTSDEVRDLTDRVQYTAQTKVLRSMGIEHRARPDGSLVVSRVHVEQILGAAPSAKRKTTAAGPDWSALHASRT